MTDENRDGYYITAVHIRKGTPSKTEIALSGIVKDDVIVLPAVRLNNETSGPLIHFARDQLQNRV